MFLRLRAKKFFQKATQVTAFILSIISLENQAFAKAKFDFIQMKDGSFREIIFNYPGDNGRYPLVLFVGGIGCYSMNALFGGPGSYLNATYQMAAKGLATVVVEKNGMGNSQGGKCTEMDFKSELENYTTLLQQLNRFPFVDPSKVIVFGHSMGGVFAPLIAKTYPVKALVVMGTLGQSWFDYSIENTIRQLKLGRWQDQDIANYVAIEKQVLTHLLKEKKSPAQIVALNPDYKNHLQLPMHYTFMHQLGDLDILKDWQEFDAKVLAIRPDADFLTSERDHRNVVATVNQKNPGSAELWVVKNMDHFFQNVSTEQESFDSSMGGKAVGYNKAFFLELADRCVQLAN